MFADLFLPCARGAEGLLAAECEAILRKGQVVQQRGGVAVLAADEVDAMRLNLWSRLAQRVLWPLAQGTYQDEHDLYDLARQVDWPAWITPDETLRVDTTAQRSPITSLNFANLRVKDAVCDALREATGARPSVDTRWPHLPLALHLTADQATLYADTSGEALFKRGWRDSASLRGEAPLKETLAATLLAASGWDAKRPLLDPCCGAGTIAIEAAQIACGIAPGLQRRFAFETMRAWRHHAQAWQRLRDEALLAAQAAQGAHGPSAPVHASDVDESMVRIATANAERAGVGHAITFSVADALERPAPPSNIPTPPSGVVVTNPPFGERMDAQGVAQGDNERFAQGLAANWKRQYPGWQNWVLSPDPDFEHHLRLKASQRVPVWNGAIECRLLRIDIVAGSMRRKPAAG